MPHCHGKPCTKPLSGALRLAEETKWVKDVKGNDLLIFSGQWSMDFAKERNPGLELLDFDKDAF